MTTLSPSDWLALGEASLANKQYDKAMECFSKLPPEWYEKFTGMARAMAMDGFPEAAIKYIAATRLNQLFPSHPDVMFLDGYCRFLAGDIEGSIEKFKDTVASWPDHHEAWANLAFAQSWLNQYDEAEATLLSAIATRPTETDLYSAFGMLRMLRDDWRTGLNYYEFRLAKHSPLSLNGKPTWNGERLDGKRLMIVAEQGMGDIIQMSRYVPFIRAMGAERVTLACHSAIYRLMRQQGLYDDVLTFGSSPVEYDVHVAMMSLPRVVYTTDGLGAMYGSGDPYLKAEPSITPSGQYNVGLCWQGNPEHPNDRYRSIPLDILKPLASTGATFWSLQHGFKGNDWAKPIDTQDFTDAAQCIAGLDLVISVDSAMAHLAGAMGKSVWTLIPSNPDWRWGLRAAQTPWYNSMELIRGEKRGEWGEAIEQMRKRLTNIAMRRAA